MKDIKENQQGLKSLASERPDVVKKMGYDPESFYAGGLAMLSSGGMADGMSLVKQGLEMLSGGSMSGGIGEALNPSEVDITIIDDEMGMDPDDAIEEYKRRQSMEDETEEELLGLSEGGIMDFITRGANKVRSFLPGGESYDTSPSVGLTDSAKDSINKVVKDRTGKDSSDLSPEEITEILKEEGAETIDSEKSKAMGEKAGGIAEALSEISNAMPQGTVTEGFMGQAIGPSQVPFRRVGMANGGLAGFGNIMNQLNNLDENELLKIINPKRAAMMSSANMDMMSGRGTGGQEDLLALIDASPLSEEDKTVQKQLINLQIGQQTLPLSPQYVASDAPYKAVYRPYFSEVTKAYNQARSDQPFSAMVAPPKERVNFNLGLQADGKMAPPRRVAGVEYAADGMLIDGQFFPEEDKLVSGPGGEREDKIPAMLSDGEFVVNARTVRGLGMQMGADPMDLEEQKDIGAMVLEYLQDTLGPNGEMAEKIGEEGLGALVRSMA
tara:strand:+ start:1089 stop:2579 length:1491 start_codon:yes stop_codon:yes gene_type:complete